MNFNLFFLLFVILVLQLRIYCQIKEARDLPLLSCNSFGVSSYILGQWSICINFCVLHEGKVKLYFFACGYPVFQYHLLKRICFSHWMVMAFLPKFSWPGLMNSSILFLLFLFTMLEKKEESSYCFSLTTGEIEAEKLTILMIKISSICYFLCAKPCWQRSTSMNSELHNNSTE